MIALHCGALTAEQKTPCSVQCIEFSMTSITCRTFGTPTSAARIVELSSRQYLRITMQALPVGRVSRNPLLTYQF